jgi:hypothetical protein
MGACSTCSDARLRLVMTLACALPILVRDPRGDGNELNLSQLAPAISSVRRAHRGRRPSRESPRPPAARERSLQARRLVVARYPRVVDQVAYHATWAAKVGLEHRVQTPAVVAHRQSRPAAMPNGSPSSSPPASHASACSRTTSSRTPPDSAPCDLPHPARHDTAPGGWSKAPLLSGRSVV